MTTQTINPNFKNSSSVIKRLVFAVDQQMSGQLAEDAEQITNHGIDGGFSGFIYYNETRKFYNENKEDIFELAIEQAEELGHKNVFEMIAGFGGAKNVGGADQFENLMAWYAAEEAARYVVDQLETEEVEEEDEA